jgi:hypothetical protein
MTGEVAGQIVDQHDEIALEPGGNVRGRTRAA